MADELSSQSSHPGGSLAAWEEEALASDIPSLSLTLQRAPSFHFHLPTMCHPFDLEVA